MKKLKILYDGKCHVCYWEVQHYLKKDKKSLLIGLDISTAEFKAEDFGLSVQAVNTELHAIDEDGHIFKGIATFIEIWKRVSTFKFLIPLFENKRLRPLFDFGYMFFARHIRPRLPKRKGSDGYCELPK